jgi:glycerol-3-phosphate acyltransferase PlsY
MTAVLVILAYLGGSVPWGFLAARSAGVDIRTKGSGNTGATNVWRVLGRRYGIPVMLLDVAKGAVPALVGLHAYGSGVAIIAGAAAVLGHTFPVFLGFGGGKGVATTGGVVIAITPLIAVLMVVLMVALLWLFRYVSLASMACAVAYPVVCAATGQPWPVLLFGLLAAAGIVARHRANIGRLRAGTESRITRFGRGT